MEHQNILIFGCLTVAIAISAFILWGPSPRPRKKKGHIVGLVNLGSTCFLNTLLQALASCAVFIQWLSQQKQEANSLTTSLHHVLWVLNGQGTADVYAPVGVLSALKRHGWMASHGEQDAHELFNVIVSTLQEETNKSLKMGSLTDALSTSDTLSQASDLQEDCEVTGELNEVNESKENNVKKLKIGDGNNSESKLVLINNSSSETVTNYEDALEKLDHGDSMSQSSTAVYYSLHQDNSLVSSPVNNCGDTDESAMKSIYELQHSKDNTLCSKTNLSKSYIQKFKASQESFKEKSPEFSGYYDRIAGCSPCIPQADAPPFQGLLTSTLQCSTCGHYSSLRYDTFDSVSLPLGDSFHYSIQKLQDLLQKFVKTEIIPDVDCEKCCKKTTAFKTLNFGKLPACLCLRIARTAWHTHSSTPTKREDYVDFPEYLPMDEYTVSARLKKDLSFKSVNDSSVEDLKKDKNYKHLYRLKSVVVHLGGVSSGHFLTYRRGALNTDRRHRIGKVEGACMDSQRWYLTSDDNVKLSTLYEAMDSIAYMLFYEKCVGESSSENISNQATPKKIIISDKKDLIN